MFLWIYIYVCVFIVVNQWLLGRISGGGLFGRNRGREGQEQAIENGK